MNLDSIAFHEEDLSDDEDEQEQTVATQPERPETDVRYANLDDNITEDVVGYIDDEPPHPLDPVPLNSRSEFQIPQAPEIRPANLPADEPSRRKLMLQIQQYCRRFSFLQREYPDTSIPALQQTPDLQSLYNDIKRSYDLHKSKHSMASSVGRWGCQFVEVVATNYAGVQLCGPKSRLSDVFDDDEFCDDFDALAIDRGWMLESTPERRLLAALMRQGTKCHAENTQELIRMQLQRKADAAALPQSIPQPTPGPQPGTTISAPPPPNPDLAAAKAAKLSQIEFPS